MNTTTILMGLAGLYLLLKPTTATAATAQTALAQGASKPPSAPTVSGGSPGGGLPGGGLPTNPVSAQLAQYLATAPSSIAPTQTLSPADVTLSLPAAPSTSPFPFSGVQDTLSDNAWDPTPIATIDSSDDTVSLTAPTEYTPTAAPDGDLQDALDSLDGGGATPDSTTPSYAYDDTGDLGDADGGDE